MQILIETFYLAQTASILQDTSDQNILQTSTSNSSNGSAANNPSASNIKIENSNSYYCNSYSSPLQGSTPAISAITGGYSEYWSIGSLFVQLLS